MQEQGLQELQGLVGAALSVPKEVVQPAFEALGKRHLVTLAEQQQLQLQPALVAAVTHCIGATALLCSLLCLIQLNVNCAACSSVIVHRLALKIYDDSYD